MLALVQILEYISPELSRDFSSSFTGLAVGPASRGLLDFVCGISILGLLIVSFQSQSGTLKTRSVLDHCVPSEEEDRSVNTGTFHWSMERKRL